MKAFESINNGFNTTFQPDELSIGVVVPIENYPNSPVPKMYDHLDRVRLIEELGFKALWIRDIPLNLPSFGDAGQTFDPFTYLGFLAGQTSSIALGVASIALPLHHPLHVAKSASTIDQLSKGRLILGVASGDRPEEYPAMGIDFESRDQLFREAFSYIRKSHENFPLIEKSHFGSINQHADILPKPTGTKLPLLITGSSRQSIDWNAKNGDGWMNYPRNLYMQKQSIGEWRALIKTGEPFDKPFMQPLYIILEEDMDFRPVNIPLGFRIGINPLIEYLHSLREIGVNHVAMNFRFNHSSIPETLEQISKYVLPQFHLRRKEIVHE